MQEAGACICPTPDYCLKQLHPVVCTTGHIANGILYCTHLSEHVVWAQLMGFIVIFSLMKGVKLKNTRQYGKYFKIFIY